MKTDNSSDNKFRYSYSAPTESERREIDSIRRAYLPQSEQMSGLERLRLLDKRVKNTATAVSLIVGIAGILLFGLGMAMAMSWNELVWGAVVSLVGCVPMALAYPLYRWIFKRQKAKYGEEILRLSEQLLNERGGDKQP